MTEPDSVDDRDDLDDLDDGDHSPPRHQSSASVALGRAMLGLGEIIEGKPATQFYEHVVEADDAGQLVDPEDLVIDVEP